LEILYIPLAVSIGCCLVKGNTARNLALYGSLLQVALTVYMLTKFKADGSYNFLFQKEWIPQAGITLKFGIDGISMLMVILTNLLMPLIILANYNRNIDRPHTFYGLMAFMHFALLGVFISLDGILFYTFWELALIPIYFICAIWGGKDKNRITLKFFIYTFFGSLFMLASLIVVKSFAGSFDIDVMYAATLTQKAAVYVLIGFFLAFAIKMPVFPFHTWQPDTYTTAPVGGTMLLSGIMLKMGIYGVIRWMIPMAPEGLSEVGNWFIVLAVIGIVYASVIAIMQSDFKRLIAYSSIGHVGLIAAGVMAFNLTGLQGGLIQMLNHGINVIGLFFIVDIIEQRTGTRDLGSLGGIARSAPRFATLFMIIMLGAVAVPLTNGFVGEFMLLKGVFDYNTSYAVIAGLTIIFGAVYMLRSYQLTMFGPQVAITEKFADVSKNEMLVLGIIAALVIFLGFNPQPVFDLTNASVEKLMMIINPIQTASI
jgi:NADH-quinone oxidoreductase subunit M